MKVYLFILVLLSAASVNAASNVVLVTLDGVRWQEVFGGIDLTIAENEKFVAKETNIIEQFYTEGRSARAEKLMPFLWKTINNNGTIIGDRTKQSLMSVSNKWFFSYPGYSEIFTGTVNDTIDSNKAIDNPEISFLEWLNTKPAYENKLAVFGSWDLYPHIFNQKRSKLYVNAGFTAASGYQISNEIKILNELQASIPKPWNTVRHDVFTYRFAKDYLLNIKPRVMTISFGETDDFAHDGKYDEYLIAIHRADQFIADLWNTIQSTEGYKNNTVLLITTDHGRGSTELDWQHHASKLATSGYLDYLGNFPEGIVGSENIWIAAIGPNIIKSGVVTTDKEVFQKQIASTILSILSENSSEFQASPAKPINEILISQ